MIKNTLSERSRERAMSVPSVSWTEEKLRYVKSETDRTCERVIRATYVSPRRRFASITWNLQVKHKRARSRRTYFWANVDKRFAFFFFFFFNGAENDVFTARDLASVSTRRVLARNLRCAGRGQSWSEEAPWDGLINSLINPWRSNNDPWGPRNTATGHVNVMRRV